MKIKIVYDSEYRFDFTPENKFDEMLLELKVVNPFFNNDYLLHNTNLKLLANRFVGWDTYVQCNELGILNIDNSIESVTIDDLSRWVNIYVNVKSEHRPFSFKLNKGYRPATSEESFIYILFYKIWLLLKVNVMTDVEFQGWVQEQLTGPDMSVGKGFPKLIHKASEQHIERIELLKRIIFKVENLQILGEVYCSNYNIKIKHHLINIHTVKYVFDVLSIPYQVIKEYGNDMLLNKVVISFGYKVDLKFIYYITSLLSEVYDKELIVYIIYANEPNGIDAEVHCGSNLLPHVNYTNVSKPINADEILRLYNIAEMEWEEFSSIFPNVNYNEKKTVSVVKNDVKNRNSEDYNFDYSPSYSEHGGAYGYDDDAINNAFDGDPENYWNID